MKYAVEMGAGVTVYIPVFINIGTATHKLMGGGGDIQIQRQRGDSQAYFYFFKIRRVG
jgi:hypothetical protein